MGMPVGLLSARAEGSLSHYYSEGVWCKSARLIQKKLPFSSVFMIRSRLDTSLRFSAALALGKGAV
jgi:hypothetical protein